MFWKVLTAMGGKWVLNEKLEYSAMRRGHPVLRSLKAEGMENQLKDCIFKASTNG